MVKSAILPSFRYSIGIPSLAAVLYDRRSLISLYNSRASGLARASRFRTGLPWITFLTANSTFLPFTVYGMSVTGMILAGT